MHQGITMKPEKKPIEKRNRVTLAIVIALFLSLIWVALQFASTFLLIGSFFNHWAIETIAFVLLSYSIATLINRGDYPQKSLYRTAFLITLSSGLLITVFSSLATATSFRGDLVIAVLIGSFSGSFIASNRNLGWWENNAPPSPQIEKDVLAWHQAYINPNHKEPFQKRLLDIAFAFISIILSMPIWALIIVLVWWEDPGPVLFVKNAVGQGGGNFKQLKFRSMITNAEKDTGPISGYEADDRVLSIGKFLRKTALDELPQLINILIGEMSYVGPRPQRTVLVHGYLQDLPTYALRHQVRPGLAGLAQVADSYDISPEEKLAWDLLYIQKANLWMDIKLAFSAFFLVFVLRWRHGIDAERTVRKLLDIEKPA